MFFGLCCLKLYIVAFRNIQDADSDKKTSEDVEKSERASPTPSLMKRLYIQEGPVKLSSVCFLKSYITVKIMFLVNSPCFLIMLHNYL